MMSDGQLYKEKDEQCSPPTMDKDGTQGYLRLKDDTLVIIGIILLVFTGSEHPDLILIVALLYVLFT